MKQKKKICLWAALLVMCQTTWADDGDLKDKFNPVMTAVTSQTIAGDARSAGMGDIGAATDPDVNSQSWNPAKYPFTISRAGLAGFSLEKLVVAGIVDYLFDILDAILS